MSKYAWQRFYEAAVLETDRSKLPALIEKAEFAITNRSRELKNSDDSHEERRLIDSARRGLAVLRWEIRIDASQQAAAN